MKRTVKYLLAVAFFAAVVLCVTAIPAFAEYYMGSCGAKVTYSLDTSTGVLKIWGKGEMYNYSETNSPWHSEVRFSVKTVNIENGVTSIGDYAFSGCSPKSVTIPDSVTSIGEGAFYYCTSLTSITIPDRVTSIGSSAFYSCTSLTSVTIPDSVTSIGSEAFSGCSKLTSVTIPDSVTSIGYLAFSGCTSLTSVNISSMEAWCGISFGDLSANPLYCAHNLYLNGSLVTDLVIPDSVTSIGYDAFSGCTSLTSVTIPDGVTSIGNYAFYNCAGLTSITIPAGVTSIGDRAFYGCNSLTSVTIPDSVTSIGNYAFYECSELNEVYYYGSQNQWMQIVRGSNNSYLTNATKHFVPSSIDVKTPPAKTVWYTGENVDFAGLTLTATYSDESTETVSSGFTCSSVSTATTGTKNVTVTYERKTTKFQITVLEIELSGINVTILPEKLAYLEGKETLDVSGGVITAYYNNDTQEEIALTAEMVTGFDNTKTGAQTLTVTYNGKTATFDITITPKSVTSIIIKDAPSKLSYLEAKDALDVSGGVITAYYNNDTQGDIPMSDDMVSGFDNTKTGAQTLTVTYGGKTATFEITVTPKTLTGIAVTTLPSKLSYLEGKETLDVVGGVITLYFDNDTSEEKSLTADMVTGFDNTTVGAQTLTVTYGGKETEFDITVTSRSVSSISVKTLPSKLAYLEGKETLDVTGGVITAYYNNDTQGDIPMSADMVSGFDNTKTGEQTLTVTYGGKTATYEITVTLKSLTGIAVTTLPSKLAYLEGKETLDVAGGAITLYYDNDTTEEKTLTADTVSGFDNTKTGAQTLTVTYGGKETTFDVTVTAKRVSGIELKTEPAKLKYFSGEALDVTGGVITVYYDNDTHEDIALTAEMVAGFDNARAGTQTLTVTYGGKTAEFELKVSGSDSVIIELSSLPAKLTYLEGREELDVTGGTLRIIFKDDDPQTIPLTADIVTGFDNTKPGAQTLTVSFLGDTEDFEITVTAKSLTSISVTTLPEKLTYLEAKDELDVTGGVVTLYYDNGSQEDIDLTRDMVTGFDNTTAGEQTLTVTLGSKTATFNVTVTEKGIESIEIKTLPAKTVYLEAKDALDITGGVITVHYDNGTQADIPMSTNLISGFDNTKPGEQTLTVTYSGKTATFDITITPKKVKSISVTRLPFKTAYLVNEEDLDPEGGVLTVKYDNDTQEEISLKEASLSGFSNTSTGAKTVTVTYGGKMTFLQIRIVAALSWEYEVTENTFTVSEAPAKGVLYAAFYDGGKLKAVKVITPKEAADIPEDSETVKVMALSGDALPLFEALSANLPNN